MFPSSAVFNYGGVYRDFPRQVNQTELAGPKQENVPEVTAANPPVPFPKLGQRQPEGPVQFFYPPRDFYRSAPIGAPPVAFPKLGQWQPHLYDPDPTAFWQRDARYRAAPVGAPPIPFPFLGRWQPKAYDPPDQTAVWQRGAAPLAPIGNPPVPFPPPPRIIISPSQYNYLEMLPHGPPPAPPGAALFMPPLPPFPMAPPVWEFWQQVRTISIKLPPPGPTILLRFRYDP